MKKIKAWEADEFGQGQYEEFGKNIANNIGSMVITGDINP
jgi:hypothetical protein